MESKVRQFACLAVMVLFLAGCERNYAHRDEIKVGMSKERVAFVTGSESGEVGEYLYRT